MMTSMAEDSGFRDIKRKPKPGWERWRPPPPERDRRWGFGGKTVWDWMQLLIVPLALVAISFLFTMQQDARQQKIETQRAEAEQELAKERAQDETLQAYLDQMSHLLLEKHLRDAKRDSVVWTLARARTFAVMPRLDAQRNQTVARFLSESKLIETNGTTVGLLQDASFNQADLAGASLPSADLIYANLTNADLSGAYLFEADLNNADLTHANLSDANLMNTDLSYAEPYEANLRGAFLTNADLTEAYLSGADLTDASLIDADLTNANLTNANLTNSSLSGANLSDADLTDANLSGARLYEADLEGASLVNANLRAAVGWTEEQLLKTKSLQGATMPNGQRYEEWLKSKGRGENGRNSVP